MAPYNQGKRKADTIDLTNSDDESPPSQRQRTQRAPTDGVTQSQRDSWANDPTEEERAEDILVLSQDDGQENTIQSFELYGTLSTKVVGIQYYNGFATEGEFVVVKREPSNPYDSNAIRIDNVRREQVGHIPKGIAKKLAKFMDPSRILVEGCLTGPKGVYDVPIALKLYGTSDPGERSALVDEMRMEKLPLDGIVQRAREEKKRKGEELKKLKSKGKGGALTPASSQQWDLGSSQTEFASSQTTAAEDLNTIMAGSERFNPREVGGVVEKFGAGEDVLAAMPMADFPEKLATKMLPYQRQALYWLQEQENPKLPTKDSADVVQLWKRSPKNPRMFTNIATNYSSTVEPTLSSGGILADDMGLGKTLEMIALMVSDPAKQPGPTLIISPLGVMSNWSGQIAHHVSPDSPLRVLTYHGSARKKMSPEDFAKYDVVITTYNQAAIEYMAGEKAPPSVPRSDGLFSFQWRRVILDEGHIIRNPKTKVALAAAALLAQSRWVLTGTPIVNNLKDLFSLVRFLHLTGGLEQLEVFNAVLARPLNAGDENASLLLQALMSTICLRRKKEMKFVDLRLPEMTEYIHKIEFQPHEREKYEALQAEAQGMLKTYEASSSRPGSSPGNTYRHLLEIILRLRQVCNHWKLCGARVTSLLANLKDKEIVDLSPENLKALQDMLQLSIDSHEDCAICLETLHEPVITACAHSFGRPCITQVIETQHKCPMCRAELPSDKMLVNPAVDLGESANDVDLSGEDEGGDSSKLDELLKILQATHKKDPSTKTVIFSQWTSFLDIIQSALQNQDFPCTRIDGKMASPARDAAMTAFSQPSESHSPERPHILLASLAVCSVGLNLVSANQVILADSWWAPAIEDQAVDRVHRLGQTRAVTVWRLVMEESIEEKVIGVQEEKRKLMMTAFREKGGKRGGQKGNSIGDIRKLLG